MRVRVVAVALLAIAALAAVDPASASWSRRKRIKGDIVGGFRPQIATSGQTVHIVFADDYINLAYSRSTDCGRTWSEATYIGHRRNNGDYAMAASGDDVHVVFLSEDELYYRGSSDGGESWKEIRKLSRSRKRSRVGEASIVASGKDVFAVWGFWAGGNRRFVDSVVSQDGGSSWVRRKIPEAKGERRGRAHAAISLDPISGRKRLHLVLSKWFFDNGFEDQAIFYQSSTDLGRHWTEETLLADSPVYTNPYALGAVEGTVHLLFEISTDDLDGLVFHKWSNDGGATWSDRTQINERRFRATGFGRRANRRMAVGEDYVHAIWDDNIVARSRDGHTWTRKRFPFSVGRGAITADPGAAGECRGTVHLAYLKYRDRAPHRLFYRRWPGGALAAD